MYLPRKHLIRQYVIVLTACVTYIWIGLSMAWPSPVLVKMTNGTEALSSPITSEDSSWIVSIGFFTTCLFTFPTASLIDIIGRKYPIIISSVPILIASFILLFAKELWLVLLARSLAGLANGIIMSVISVYSSEIASKEIRGALGAIIQISAATGMLIIYTIGPFVSYLTLNSIYTGIVVLTTVPLFFLPESPYYLYSKGKINECTNVLRKLRSTEDSINEEIKQYAITIESKKIDKRDIWKSRTFFRGLAIVLLLGIGSQLTGYVIVTFYLQTILQQTQTSLEPSLASAIIGWAQILASFFTSLLTDRFGRKPISTTMYIGMAIGMCGMGTFFKLKEIEYPISGFLDYLPLISILLVVFSYSAGHSAIYYMLIAELFSGPARAIGVASGVTTIVLFIFIVTKFYPLLTVTIGTSVTYWILSGCCLITCSCIALFIPETKGKTFNEIQQALGAKE